MVLFYFKDFALFFLHLYIPGSSSRYSDCSDIFFKGNGSYLIFNVLSITVMKCGWNELDFSYTFKNKNPETPLEILGYSSNDKCIHCLVKIRF